MTLLSRDDILNAKDTETVTVNVPQWGGDVIVSTMSGQSRDKLELAFSNKGSLENVRARIVALSVVDSNGNLMFTDADIMKLGRKSAKALDIVFTAAQKLNAIGDKEVEELAKE